MVYFVAPAIDNKVRMMNKKVLGIIGAVLITIFTIDVIYSQNNPNSGRGINDYSTITVFNNKINTKLKLGENYV